MSRVSAICKVALMGGLCSFGVGAFGGVVSAQYGAPTDRYTHGILGDAIEYGTLSMVTNGNKRVTVTLPEDHVFEDLLPRLADVDGDGDKEVIVIETDVTAGAALAIYDETGKIAETPHIGLANRWLAPIGVADFNRDGAIDIAYIDRPHLAKTLMVWTFRNGELSLSAKIGGLTNHRIGENLITSGVRMCHGLPEMITANSDWTKVVATRMDGRSLTKRIVGPFRGPKSVNKALKGC